MHINHRLQILKRSANSLQFGLGADSLVIEGLTPADHRLIEALEQGTDGKSLDAIAARCGLPPARARYLIDVLQPVLVGGGEESALVGLRADRLAADIAQWSVIYERDAGPVMERRARSVIRVIGLGRTGSAIAQGLATAGIGTLLLEDDVRVDPADVAAAAYRLCDVGLVRSAAVRRQIHHIDPTIQTHFLPKQATKRPMDPAHFAVDLVVAVSQDVPDFRLLGELVQHGQAHLPVMLRERDTLIGPLVLPGETACTACVARHIAAADPGSTSYEPPAAPQPKPKGIFIPMEESALALSTAATAVLQILLYVDGAHRPSSWSTVLQLRAADGSHFKRSYEPHAECGCSHPAVAILSSAPAVTP